MGTVKRFDSPGDKSSLWPRALKWLLVLGPLFFISYGAVNEFTATRSDVGEFVFDWERDIPFWDWTIVPYMSIDLLYAVSLFLCTNKTELDRHGLRLLLATLISIGFFLLFPLQFTFIRPETYGIFGSLFDLLTSFDKPYNQAPSLHISLLVLIWCVFSQHIKGALLPLVMHSWMFLIGLSVLTTWQHHFIDVIGGLVVGLLLIYLIPGPLLGWRWVKHNSPGRWRIAGWYGAGCILLSLVAGLIGGWGLLLLWPAIALAVVAIAYAGADTTVFQYTGQRMSVAALIVLAPYLVVARLSAWWLSRKRQGCVEVIPGIWLGRVPERADMETCLPEQVLNVTAEMHPINWHKTSVRRVPMLDLVAPQLSQLKKAVTELSEMLRAEQTVLVHCALGLSRSALVIAGWLLYSGRVSNADEAISLLRKVRPDCVINTAQRESLLVFASEDTESLQGYEKPKTNSTHGG